MKLFIKQLLSRLFKKENDMVSEMDATRYLLSLDPNGDYFNKDLVEVDGSFYEGNARLNKILHLAQNMYIGRTGTKLIDTDFYAYNNGSVIPNIQENYAMLLATKGSFSVSQEAKDFLKKVFLMLKDAPILELINIDHEDPAWIEKHNEYYKEDEKMDSLKYADDYKLRYEAANFYLDHMELT